MMRKCRITVVKKTFNRDLAEEYGVEGIGPCPFFEVGQEFVTDNRFPEGFCPEAWDGLRPFVFALAHGDEKTLFFNDDWIRRPGTAVCSCNDGLRPVIFKIEGIGE